MVPDQRVVVLAPQLVNYGFVRWLMGRRLEGHRGAARGVLGPRLNAVTLAPGKVVMNAGSPTVVRRSSGTEVEVIQVDFSESQSFAIAGLHCATLELRARPAGRLATRVDERLETAL